MRTLLIDNHDSFTYNVFQLLAEVNGVEPLVVANDEADWEQLARLRFDNVVLSPGPGRPEHQRDFGVSAEAIRRCRLPLLGICLGHQGLGWVHGGAVVRAPTPMHGRVGPVEHSGSPLFAGIPSRFEAVRYHSLCLERPLPPVLEEIAWSADGVTMALAHRTRPQWGVQFHPESIAAEYGRQLLANFRDLTASRSPVGARGPAPAPVVSEQPETAPPTMRLRLERLDLAPDPAWVFGQRYGASPSAFWLDSSNRGEASRFSFMGDASGPLGETITYDSDAHRVTVRRAAGNEVLDESIFEYLERRRRRLRPLTPTTLPFDFDCGFAGYLGYELKAECGGERAHGSRLPDAAFILADRLIAFDHTLGHAYLLCLTEPGAEPAADRWLEATAAALRALSEEREAEPDRPPGPPPVAGEPRLARSRRHYLDDIAACGERLLEGESYEVCLTNTVEAEVDADSLDLYLRLRRANPAPFAAYLRFDDLAVLSSSPERFLRIDTEGAVEARPIKGTSRRAADAAGDAELAAQLGSDEKNRAENLMIVDLLRNDLGRVCELGSIAVPGLMEVDTYETVHQLVSTVTGQLRPRLSALDCVHACFPPGSMTGAPKRRTMEILDGLEGRARGVYSGALGYLGLGGGCDLSVTIRTIVLDGVDASIGAGGAIVAQSDPEAEYGEMLLKAAAPLRAIDPGAELAAISLTDPRPAAASPPPASPDLTS